MGASNHPVWAERPPGLNLTREISLLAATAFQSPPCPIIAIILLPIYLHNIIWTSNMKKLNFYYGNLWGIKISMDIMACKNVLLIEPAMALDFFNMEVYKVCP